MGREPGVAPVVLVPAPAKDPRARRHFTGARRDAGHDLVVGRGAHQVHVAKRISQVEQMDVGIDHARDHGATVQVKHLGVRAAQSHHTARGTGGHDATGADCHCLREWPVLVDRVDARVGDDQVGGLRGHPHGQGGECDEGEPEGETTVVFHHDGMSGRCCGRRVCTVFALSINAAEGTRWTRC